MVFQSTGHAIFSHSFICEKNSTFMNKYRKFSFQDTQVKLKIYISFKTTMAQHRRSTNKYIRGT